MTISIAVAGKGGSGKTTIAALIIRYLVNSGSGPIMAVDADPNSNLAESLGLEVNETIGSIIAGFNEDKINIPPGMTKENYLEYRLNQAVVESHNIDLIAMGRGEGPDCYCYPNTLLRKFIDSLADNYSYIVMDNEAGMEHLSRRTTRNVDDLIVVSNHSVKGLRAVDQIAELTNQLKLGVKRRSVLINNAPAEISPLVKDEMARLKITPSAVIPSDDSVYQYDLALKPLLDLPENSAAVREVSNFMIGLKGR